MRLHSALALAILAASPLAAHSQTAPAPAAPASPAAQRYTTEDTDIGTLLDDPAAKAVLAKHIPAIVSSDQIDMARSLTLKQVQQYAPDRITDQNLIAIDADLAKLPPKK